MHAPIYQPRDPENTVVFYMLQQYWNTWRERVEAGGGEVPLYVKNEVEAVLRGC